MKTVRYVPETMSIDEFAEKHDLTMEIRERHCEKDSPMRFYASFQNGEIKEQGMLVGTHGNGATPEQAIEQYALKISFGRLVINAMSPDRREIEVPGLT